MIYCDACGAGKGYPTGTDNQKFSLCNICNQVLTCNDVPETRLTYLKEHKDDPLTTQIGETGKPIVPGVGPPDADIMIFGEAPGEDEERYATPFIGKSGQLLTRFLTEAGLPRNTLYIDNIIPIRPPNNKIENLKDYGLSKETFYKAAHKKVMDMKPKVVLLLGNVPLDCFIGGENITKRRGSVYMWHGIPIVPSLHPAGILRGNHQGGYLLKFDIAKVKMIAGGMNPVKEREFITNPDMPTIVDRLSYLRDHAQFLTVDIETRMYSFIDCIGFTDADDWAICVPFHAGGVPRWTQGEELYIRQLINEVMASRSLKIMHNAMYELFWFYFYGIPCNNLWMDTMLAMHTIHPEFKKALWSAQSLYSNEPYHKDEGRDSDDDESRWIYNCKDVAVTHEISAPLLDDLRSTKLTHFFFNHVMREVKPYLAMSVAGVKIDQKKWAELTVETIKERDEYQAILDEKIGKPLNVKSFPQMKAHFYDKLKLKPILLKGRPTLNEDALWELSAKYPNAKGLQDVIYVRNRRTFLDLFLSKRWDKDGRIRYSFNVAGTVTGRSSASDCPFGTGLNPQQSPRPGGEPDRPWKHFREVFVVDGEDWTFLQGDLAQADARVVTFLCDDRIEKGMYVKGESVHIRSAMICTGKSEEECAKGTGAYDLGKASKHGYSYGEGPIRLFRQIIKELGRMEQPLPEGFNVAMCKQILKRFDEGTPLVKRVFHDYIEHELRRGRIIYNPFGRRRVFTEMWGQALFRSGYSTIPQGTVAEIIHRAMFHIHDEILRRIYTTMLRLGTRLVWQVHDSLIVHCLKTQVEQLKVLMKEWMEVPIKINGDVMIIPVEFKEGKNLGEV